MSDYFDTQLQEGSAHVAGSLTPRTPAEVREHAKHRARRARAAVSTLTAVAVLAVGGVTFSLDRHGSSTTNAAGTSDTAAAKRKNNAPKAGSTRNTSAPAPDRYVAGAWLSKSHLPYATAITWQINPQSLGKKLSAAVQLVPQGSEYFASSMSEFGTYCSIPALSGNAIADQQESFYGPITSSTVPSSAGIPATARQSTVFYRTQSAAASAWANIGTGFAACAKFETGKVSGESKTYPSTGTVSQLVNEPTVQCWTNLAAVSISQKVTDFLDNACFVLHGTLIGSVDIGFEGPSALSSLDFHAVDASLVSDLSDALTAYDGS